MKSEIKQKTTEIEPKRVIFAWNYLEWGGAQVYFLGIASRIKDRAEVKMLVPRKTGGQLIQFCHNLEIPYQLIDVENDLGPAPNVKRKIQRHWHKFWAEHKLVKILKAEGLKGNIVHVELAPWQSLFSLILLCLRTKVFITMHNSLPAVSSWRRLLWKLKFRVIAKFDNFHLFASNQEAKNSLKPLVRPEFLEKVRVTYTNVNPDEVDEALETKIERAAQLEKFGLPADRFLVFCVGQFIDRKGRWTFLEAARKLRNDHQDIGFVWISNSILNAEELEKIKQFDVSNNFFLIDSESVGKRHVDLFNLLKIADVFTLPSFVEGLPISLLEAMALGIPSISTNINAIPEAVKDLETGILIEAGDSPALVEAILKIKNDRKLAEKLSNSGRKHVLKKFNEKVVAEIAFTEYRQSFKK